MSSPSLEHGGLSTELPTKHDAFEGLLEEKRPRFLQPADRWKVKQIVEGLARDTGRSRNDILAYYSINLIEYYDWIDTAKEPSTQVQVITQSTRKNLQNSRTVDLSDAEKLALLEKVDRLHADDQTTLAEACEYAGLHLRRYYRLDAQRTVLKERAKKAETNGHPIAIPVLQDIPPGEWQVVLDAAKILVLTTRDTQAHVARLLGTTNPTMQEWRTTGVEPLFKDLHRPSMPLDRWDLVLSTEHKVRLLDAMSHITKQKLGVRNALATTLGYRQATVDRWSGLLSAIRKFLSKDQPKDSNIVSYEHLSGLSSSLQEPEQDVRRWLKALGYKDSYGQVALGPSLQPGIALEPKDLMSHWHTLWADEEHMDPEQRKNALDTLVRYYKSLVGVNANRVNQKLARSQSVDLLESYALVGLSQAIDRYTLQFDTKFTTYAPLRITGEIWDGIRHDDVATRTQRAVQRLLKEANAKWYVAHGQDPSDEELASVLGISLEALLQKQKIAREASLESLDAKIEGKGRVQSRLDYISDEPLQLPTEVSSEVLETLLRGLTHAQQRIIRGYYFEHKTMREIAEELDLSESRISQMHTDLLMQLEERIADHEGKDDILGIVAASYLPPQRQSA